MPILEAEGLVKSYGSRKVVDGVSFSVEFAEIVGLLGQRARVTMLWALTGRGTPHSRTWRRSRC